jgi:DNA-binding helix-hairpin-helix protein with protein kinase domain
MTASGRRLRLGKPLGKGGEAEIFQIEDDRTLAAKLYIDRKASERFDKVNAMIYDRLFERTQLVAFPIEAATSKGVFVGFTMRQVIGRQTSASALHS